jgi:hypothetical protein
MADDLTDGGASETITRLKRELDEAHRSINLLEDREKDLMARVRKAEGDREILKRERRRLREEIGELESHQLENSKLIVMFSSTSMGLQNQMHKAYLALDATYGIEKNPIREPLSEGATLEHKIDGYEGTPVSRGQDAFYTGAKAAMRHERIAPLVARLRKECPDQDVWSWFKDPWTMLNYPKNSGKT